MAEQVHGRSIPETIATLTGEDWYDEELTGRAAEHLEYVDLDLTGSTSQSGLELTECVLRRAHFNQSTHTGAAFANCTFIDCEFFGATFTDCKFIGSSFLRCRFTQLTVIARNSTFVYKRHPVSIADIARDLAVRYVLEGSVRRLGKRVRITAQLIDRLRFATPVIDRTPGSDY